MKRWVAKLLALLVIYFIPFVCTILPIKVHEIFRKRGKQGETVLSWLMCFGGGVFFATYILHMGPEVRTILTPALLEPYNISYPICELIISIGFFIVLVIEKTILAIHRRNKRIKKQQCAECPFNIENPKSADVNRSTDQPMTKFDVDIEDIAVEKLALNACSCDEEKCSDPKEHNHVQHDHHHKIHPRDQHHHTHPDLDDEEFTEIHVSRSLVLAVALSLHRIFEGMSVGLKHTVQGVANLLLAVMCHEAVIGFSLGLQFVGANFGTKKILLFSFVCSLIMPLGVAIGMILTELHWESNSLNVINGVLQAISTGTFIYVTFFEILQDEITHHDTHAGKVISLFLGFSVMALLSLIPEPAEVLNNDIFNSSLTPTSSPLD